MPILPTYGGVSTSIATPTTPRLPDDPAIKQLGQLGEATEKFGNTMGHVMQKRQALEDEATAMQRLMQASSDLSDINDSLSKPEIGRKGREVFSQSVDQQRAKWFKDLSPGAAQRLEQHLAPKLIEYRQAAAKTENRVHLNDYQGGGVVAMTQFAEMASRRTGPDDASETPEFAALKQYLETGEKNGYYTPEEVEKTKQQALTSGASSRLYKVVSSDSQDEIKNVLNVYDKENAKPGSTFLAHMDPQKRTAMKIELQNRLETLKNQDLARIREERIETERRHAEEVKAVGVRIQQKLDNPEKYGPLTQEYLDQQADLRLIEADNYKTFRNQLEERQRSGTLMTGGRGNPATVNYFTNRVYSTRSTGDAVAVKEELKKAIAAGDVPSGQGQVGQVWLAHLDSLTRIPRDQDITPAKQTADAKKEVELRLRTTGPMAQYLKAGENDAIADIHKALDINAINNYRESPQEIIDRMLPAARARVGQPAQTFSSDTRRSLGMEVTADPKRKIETIKENVTSTLQQYDSAPPGPEGDALRAAAKKRLEALRTLHDVEVEQAKRKAATEESKAKSGGAGSGSAAPTPSASGPLQGPRR